MQIRNGTPRRRVGTSVLVCLGLLLATSCSQDDPGRGAPPTTRTASVPDPPPPTAATPTTTAPAPAFDASIQTIGDAERARMTASWRPGCPVPLQDLRLLALDHWGYDGIEHRGELVAHADLAAALVEVFRQLFDARFPIERMQLVDAYGGDDHLSTLDNNTAAFNCREVVGRPGSWSEHAYGRAIDVNPRVNPYLLDPRLRHPTLAPFVDRARDDPGMIRADDVVVRAFASVGWPWGGAWSSPDYQHFSATGR